MNHSNSKHMKSMTSRIARQSLGPLFVPLAGLLIGLPTITASAQDTLKVTGKEYRETVQLQGASVHGNQQTDISAKLGGFVKSIGKVDDIEIDVGSYVKKGTILVELDIPEMLDDVAEKKALVVQANSAIAQAEAAGVEASAVVAQKQAALKQVEAQTAQKQAVFRFSEAKLNRLNVLAGRGSISKDKLDEARYDVDAAKAACDSTEADIQAAQADIKAAMAAIERTKADKVSAQAKADVAKAAANRLTTMMDYTTIKAPYDGIITSRMIDLGTYVQPAEKNSGATPLFQLTQIDRVRIVAGVPNNQITKVAKGQTAVFGSIGGLTGREFQGTITRTAGTLDPKTRTMQIEVHLKNPAVDIVSNKKFELKPGLFGTLTVVRKNWTGANLIPVVPTTAVGKDSNGNRYVVVTGSGEPKRRRVEIGFDDARTVGISEGLKLGETIIRSGVSAY